MKEYNPRLRAFLRRREIKAAYSREQQKRYEIICNEHKHEQESTMARMSKDRVKFRLLVHYWEKAGFRSLLEQSLRITDVQALELFHRASNSQQGYAEVICRPSQFARFLIMRDGAGLQNMFKELHAELFTPVVDVMPLDISANPAPYVRD